MCNCPKEAWLGRTVKTTAHAHSIMGLEDEIEGRYFRDDSQQREDVGVMQARDHFKLRLQCRHVTEAVLGLRNMHNLSVPSCLISGSITITVDHRQEADLLLCRVKWAAKVSKHIDSR